MLADKKGRQRNSAGPELTYSNFTHQHPQKMSTQNLIACNVKYIGPTDFRGSRIKLTIPLRKWSLTISYDYTAKDAEDGAVKYLATKGLAPVSRACMDGFSTLLFSFENCDEIAELFRK
jgi:hypothetical protein